MSALLDLATRVEQATGPDRELDRDIALHFGLYDRPEDLGCFADPAEAVVGGGGQTFKPPTYTASIDAALTLVPEGWWLAGLHFCHVDFRSDSDPEWSAEVYGPVTWAVIDREVGQEPQYETATSSAASPALALCAAALRSRAAMETAK